MTHLILKMIHSLMQLLAILRRICSFSINPFLFKIIFTLTQTSGTFLKRNIINLDKFCLETKRIFDDNKLTLIIFYSE